MLVVVKDEKRPRMHEKGSDIASAAMPSWATCQSYTEPGRNLAYQILLMYVKSSKLLLLIVHI